MTVNKYIKWEFQQGRRWKKEAKLGWGNKVRRVSKLDGIYFITKGEKEVLQTAKPWHLSLVLKVDLQVQI